MLWIRYQYKGKVSLGCIQDDGVHVQPYNGDLFNTPQPSGDLIPYSDVVLLTPTTPSKMIALWNNYQGLADAKKLSYPKTPLYLIKPPNTYLAAGMTIRHPPFYSGKVFFEGELGIVIGKQATSLDSIQEAKNCIFGYTCINDVTAFDLLKEDANFDQWTRAKGFDTFGVFGPAIATDLDFSQLVITTFMNHNEMQHYPASDMILSPPETVRQLSQSMSLLPGDIICCGTSIGLGAMDRGCTIEVEIAGIGKLCNTYQ